VISDATWRKRNKADVLGIRHVRPDQPSILRQLLLQSETAPGEYAETKRRSRLLRIMRHKEGGNMNIAEIIAWVKANWLDITNVMTAIIALASVIVKITPTIKDNELLEKIIKFISKYIALNRTVDDDAVRTAAAGTTVGK
jgi:hypothetical protein